MAKPSIIVGRSSGNLNFKTAQKMIHRFLTCDRIKTRLDEGKIINHVRKEPEIKVKPYTKEELAEKLSITQEELDQLNLPSFYRKMAKKIFLPLIRLYCATKFSD